MQGKMKLAALGAATSAVMLPALRAGMRRYRWIAMVGLVLLAVVPGCSRRDARHEVRQPKRTVAVRPVDPRDVLLRPKRFFDDTETINRVTVRLTRRCMQRKGAVYSGLAELVDRIQGALYPDMEYLRREGFGFAHYFRPLRQPEGSEVEPSYRAFQGDRNDRVEYRTLVSEGSMGAGGCFGAAKRRISGSVKDWFWAVSAQQDYWLIFANVTMGDPRWTPVATAWSACMARAGYPGIKGPAHAWMKAREQFVAAFDAGQRIGPGLRHMEIDLAVADGRCELSSGMPQVQRILREAFLARASAEYLRDLQRIATARTRALATIRADGLDR